MSFFCFVEKRFLQLIVPFCDDVINIVLQYDTAPLLLFFDEPDVVSEHMVVKIMGFLAVPIETTRLISYGGLHSRKWSFSEFLHVDNINNLVLTITKQTELCEFNYQNLRFGEKLDCQDYFQPLVSGLLPDSNLF